MRLIDIEKVREVVREYLDEGIIPSSREVARKLEVSHATVLRVVRDAGYSGWDEFIMSVIGKRDLASIMYFLSAFRSPEFREFILKEIVPYIAKLLLGSQREEYLEKIAYDLLERAGYRDAVIFVIRVAIPLPAPVVSLGFTLWLLGNRFVVGLILIQRELSVNDVEVWKGLIAHELGHICLNHVQLDHILRFAITKVEMSLAQKNIESAADAVATAFLADFIAHVYSSIRVDMDLEADRWSVRVLGSKDPVLKALNFLKTLGVKHCHGIVDLDRRIRYVKELKL